jgi:hypothetical protein
VPPYEVGDLRDAPKVVDLERGKAGIYAKLSLDREKDLDKSERVEQPALDQVEVRRSDLDVDRLQEEPIDPLR